MLRDGLAVPFLVCRNCYRPADLEYRIACENAGVAYEAPRIRESLLLLRDFYLDRLGESRDPDLLVEDDERERMALPIRAALADVDRRLRIGPVEADQDG